MRASQPWRTNRARVLRSRQTTAEDIVWSHLRNRRLAGLEFVRQPPIGSCFVDFACRDRKVVVEIASDEKRRAELAASRYRVFRADNDDCFDNIDGVLDSLLAFIAEKAV